MGKKLKITEDQLKRIMSQNVNEQESDINEFYFHPDHVIAQEDAKKVAETLRQKYSEIFNGDNKPDIEEYLNAFSAGLRYEFGLEGGQQLTGDPIKGDEEPVDYTMGSDDENMMPNPPSEINMNESVIKIKSEFKRFL
jgi:hypothetical protein